MCSVGVQGHGFEEVVVLHHLVELCNLITINVCAYECPENNSSTIFPEGFVRDNNMPVSMECQAGRRFGGARGQRVSV